MTLPGSNAGSTSLEHGLLLSLHSKVDDLGREVMEVKGQIPRVIEEARSAATRAAEVVLEDRAVSEKKQRRGDLIVLGAALGGLLGLQLITVIGLDKTIKLFGFFIQHFPLI